MRNQFLRWIPGIIFLLVFSVACNISAGGPKPPEQKIPISTEAAESLESAVLQAVTQSAVAERVAITVTEEQATSYVALELASKTDTPFKDPQVQFRDGKVQLFGQVEQGILSANLQITLTSQVNSEGVLRLQIETINLGNIPAPDALKSQISNIVDKSVNGYLTQLATGFKIENLVIADGLFTITGVKQQ